MTFNIRAGHNYYDVYSLNNTAETIKDSGA
jgi:hypothetical protein